MSKKPKHDEIIRSAFENPLVSKEFFEMHLPPHIQNLISFEKLKMEKDSFVDKRLKKSIVDILFSAKFGEKKGYLYLLLEHQSTPEYKMALRLFRYMFKIAEYHKKSTKSKKLPFIYPLIFYNGQKKYNAPRNLWELFENSELVKTTWTNDYQLINVHDIPDEKLKEKAWSGILQFFMKHIHERDLLKRWEEVADLLPKFAKIDIGIEHIELILCYTLTRIKQDDIIEVEKLLKSKLNLKKRENIMKSIAHHWMQQGREEEKAIMVKKIAGRKDCHS
ncbi:Transposase and inactivated derivative [Rickettsia bellii OSU 85-389]|uniref:Rpn family recombination-promoting nuclease/putative transposase n=1 Tax=Rickettsia bellii TaxID=33990 RepID=UPI0000DB0E0D|nr:Rpn family recombination-promoting nuclease/putative transposase [Rickettsia bellii]ABV78702.1 Transposase and inactivated derivative [Rickettsia bellii OSU 85-389]